jgi:hypothetical protein
MDGLQSVGVHMDDDYVTAARGTLLSLQNDDGGWGEETRDEPTQQGSIEYQPAASNPTHPGWDLNPISTRLRRSRRSRHPRPREVSGREAKNR